MSLALLSFCMRPSLTKMHVEKRCFWVGKGGKASAEGGIKVKYMRRIHKKTCDAIKKK